MWSVISHAMARHAESVDSLESGTSQELRKLKYGRLVPAAGVAHRWAH
jgi:hypothetical protein